MNYRKLNYKKILPLLLTVIVLLFAFFLYKRIVKRLEGFDTGDSNTTASATYDEISGELTIETNEKTVKLKFDSEDKKLKATTTSQVNVNKPNSSGMQNSEEVSFNNDEVLHMLIEHLIRKDSEDNIKSKHLIVILEKEKDNPKQYYPPTLYLFFNDNDSAKAFENSKTALINFFTNNVIKNKNKLDYKDPIIRVYKDPIIRDIDFKYMEIRDAKLLDDNKGKNIYGFVSYESIEYNNENNNVNYNVDYNKNFKLLNEAGEFITSPTSPVEKTSSELDILEYGTLSIESSNPDKTEVMFKVEGGQNPNIYTLRKLDNLDTFTDKDNNKYNILHEIIIGQGSTVTSKKLVRFNIFINPNNKDNKDKKHEVSIFLDVIDNNDIGFVNVGIFAFDDKGVKPYIKLQDDLNAFYNRQMVSNNF